MKRIDGNADGDYADSGVDKGPYYYLSDTQFSTVALITDTAVLVERVDYDAYGKARHHWPTDLDGDGDGNDSGDASVFTYSMQNSNSIEDANYRANCDFDRDGDVDGQDSSFASTQYGTSVMPALPAGKISYAGTGGADNSIGYDGYVYNWPVALYTVRFRHYSATNGRWLERDPLKTTVAPNLYLNVLAKPITLLDPLGLEPKIGIAILEAAAAGDMGLFIALYEILHGVKLTTGVALTLMVAYAAKDDINKLVEAVDKALRKPIPCNLKCSEFQKLFCRETLEEASKMLDRIGNRLNDTGRGDLTVLEMAIKEIIEGQPYFDPVIGRSFDHVDKVGKLLSGVARQLKKLANIAMNNPCCKKYYADKIRKVKDKAEDMLNDTHDKVPLDIKFPWDEIF